MCQHVALEDTFLGAFVFTLLAAERLFSGMNKNVLFQMRSVVGRVGTHGAFVDFSPPFFVLVLDVKGILEGSVRFL